MLDVMTSVAMLDAAKELDDMTEADVLLMASAHVDRPRSEP